MSLSSQRCTFAISSGFLAGRRSSRTLWTLQFSQSMVLPPTLSPSPSPPTSTSTISFSFSVSLSPSSDHSFPCPLALFVSLAPSHLLSLSSVLSPLPSPLSLCLWSFPSPSRSPLLLFVPPLSSFVYTDVFFSLSRAPAPFLSLLSISCSFFSSFALSTRHRI